MLEVIDHPDAFVGGRAGGAVDGASGQRGSPVQLIPLSEFNLMTTAGVAVELLTGCESLTIWAARGVR